MSRFLSKDGFVVGCGCWDSLSAMVIQEAGFDFSSLGSSITSASDIGVGDLGFRTPLEQLDLARKILAVTSKPLIVDAEQGWGSEVNVGYWVKEFERIGVAGIFIDDIAGALKLPFVPGAPIDIEPLENFLAKVKMAAESKSSNDFLVIARTGARFVYGEEEQISRSKLLKKAGADVIFATAGTVELLKAYRRQIDGPLLATCNPYQGEVAKLKAEDFRQLGMNILIYEMPVFYAAFKAAREAAKQIRTDKGITGLVDKMARHEDLVNFLGYSEVLRKIKQLREFSKELVERK